MRVDENHRVSLSSDSQRLGKRLLRNRRGEGAYSINWRSMVVYYERIFLSIFYSLEERMGLIRSDLLDLDIADLFEIPPGEIKFDDFAKNKNIWEKKRKSNSTVISLRNYKFEERTEREREWYFPSTTSRIIHLQLSPSLNNVWLSSFLRHLPPSFRFIQILS